MRIVAGRWRGRRILAPAGRDTRPTSDRVREALFSILGPIEGESVLDVFSGSGALALEALSRGAATATAVENSRAAVACIHRNAEALQAGDRLRVLARDWRAALAGERAAGRWYGVILADPPYRRFESVLPELGPALAAIARPGGTVVIEHSASRSVLDVPGLDHAGLERRVYGDTALCVIRVGGSER